MSFSNTHAYNSHHQLEGLNRPHDVKQGSKKVPHLRSLITESETDALSANKWSTTIYKESRSRFNQIKSKVSVFLLLHPNSFFDHRNSGGTGRFDLTNYYINKV